MEDTDNLETIARSLWAMKGLQQTGSITLASIWQLEQARSLIDNHSNAHCSLTVSGGEATLWLRPASVPELRRLLAANGITLKIDWACLDSHLLVDARFNISLEHVQNCLRRNGIVAMFLGTGRDYCYERRPRRLSTDYVPCYVFKVSMDDANCIRDNVRPHLFHGAWCHLQDIHHWRSGFVWGSRRPGQLMGAIPPRA